MWQALLRFIAVRAIEAELNEIMYGRAIRQGMQSLATIQITGNVEGVQELSHQFGNLANLKQGDITKAAKRGVQIAFKSAKREAPEETGNLKAGIKIIPEKSSKKGKKVYQVGFNRAFNSIFQKPIENVGKYGGRKKTGYYPVSVNSGFRHSKEYVPGYHFLENSLKKNSQSIERTIIREMENAINKAIR